MKRTVAAGLLTALLATTGLAADWQPVAGPLSTKWAKDVSPDKVHPEYPRPQMVRKNWTNLNGLWDYTIVPEEAGEPKEYSGKILVPFPFESSLSGVMKRVGPKERLWYRRQIERPKLAKDERLLLHFGAVDWEAKVWVNGNVAAEHRGGYDPFSCDITDFLGTADVPLEILVSVLDPIDAGTQPRGKQVRKPEGIWYTPTTGIWQTVWLERVPQTYIRDVRIVTDFDQRRLSIKADVVNPQPGWKLGILVGSQTGQGGFFHRTWHTELDQPYVEEIPEDVTPSFARHCWSPDNPHLIDVYVALVADPKADLEGFGQEWLPKLTGPLAPEKKPPVPMVDWVKSYTAIRKISLGKDDAGRTRMLLNGKPVFQFGPLDQGFWPDGLYTAPTDEALRYDLEVTKKLGFNMVRKHVKVEPARWYHHCDRLGLLVWQDMPSGDRSAPWDPNGRHNGQEIERSQESAQNFKNEWREIITDLNHFPCIVVWVPFNEAWGQFETVGITKYTQELDPTRLVNCASGGNDFPVGQISDLHRYPGPGMPKLEEKRAAVLGEFGGLGLPLEGHTWQAKDNWGYRSFKTKEDLQKAYLQLIANLRSLVADGLSAAVYTQTTDVEIEVNGLLTYDRAVLKLDAEKIAAAHRKLWLPPPKVAVLVPTSQKEGQKWRYTFVKPEGGWETSDYDVSDWKEGPGGFGEPTTPGSHVRTVWKTGDIWLRRSFELPAGKHEGLHLAMHHDEDAEVYLNGVLIAKTTGFTTGYTYLPLDEEGVKAVKEGPNTLTVHCRQTGGGQYIDVGIVKLEEVSK